MNNSTQVINIKFKVYRHEQRHLRAALRSDDFAAGPFMTYLTETNEDESGMFALCFWQEIERFREEFSGMQQTDRLLTMDQIFTKYLLNDRGCQEMVDKFELLLVTNDFLKFYSNFYEMKLFMF